MSINTEGTKTGRISSKTPARSNTPKPGGRVMCTRDGREFFVSDTGRMGVAPESMEIPGMHLGPRTKSEYPWSYDPLLIFSTGEKPTDSCYSDRFNMWYGYDVVKAKREEHFGDQGDQYGFRSPKAIEAFLRDLLSAPELRLVRIEEHCNVSNGYPCWHFGYLKGETDLKS